jgi:hypothetical protein
VQDAQRRLIFRRCGIVPLGEEVVREPELASERLEDLHGEVAVGRFELLKR